jgi:NAD(P)H-quinone oxidoreductase subunit 4L
MALEGYLAVSALLFGIGLYGVLARRNMLTVLMSIELIFNAANLNFVAFNRFLHPARPWGHSFHHRARRRRGCGGFGPGAHHLSEF